MNLFSELLNHDLELWKKNIKSLDTSADGHIKGAYAECILRDILKKFTPQAILISNGWIIDENGKRSEERDILVYDRNLAPSFLFDAEIGLIPLTAILYDIQIKCSLTQKTIRDALNKFDSRCQRNALLSLNGYNLLKNYLSIDSDALINPKIKILSSEDDAYYFWSVKYVKYSEIFSPDDVIQSVAKSINVKKLTVEASNVIANGFNLQNLEKKHIKIYEWIKIKTTHNVKGFIVGFLNTLYKNKVSNYILDENELASQLTLTRVYCDDEGNILFSEKDLDKGLQERTISLSCKFENGKAILSLA